MKKCNAQTLINLFFVFCKIGSMTFGGGIAMLPIIRKELIDKRKWMTDEELIDYYAVGQSTPGIIAVNISTFIGFKKGGIVGGIISTLGISFPSVVIIIALAGLIKSVNDFPIMQKALKGINVAVTALITDAAINFSKKTIKNLFSVVILIISFSLVFFFHVPPALIIPSSILLGSGIYFITRKTNS